MSASFSLDKADGMRILKVFGWSVTSAALAAAVTLVASLKMDPQFMLLVPFFNTLLFSLQQFLQESRP